MSLRMKIVWDVLEGAKDVGDELIIAACRRLIIANRGGRRADRKDWKLIVTFAD